MTVAPGMAGRIDAAVSGENRQETPKALRNGPEVEKTCIRACGPTRSSGGVFGRRLASGPALLEPVALAVHFQDVDVVGDAVEQRAGEFVHDNTGKSSLGRRASAS